MKTVLKLIFIFSWVGCVHCAQDTKSFNAAAMAVAVKPPSISHRYKPKRTVRVKQLQKQQQALAKSGAAEKVMNAQVLQCTYEVSPQNSAALNQDLCGDTKEAAAAVKAVAQQQLTPIATADKFEFVRRSAQAYHGRKTPQKRQFTQEELENLDGLYSPNWQDFYEQYIA